MTDEPLVASLCQVFLSLVNLGGTRNLIRLIQFIASLKMLHVSKFPQAYFTIELCYAVYNCEYSLVGKLPPCYIILL